MTSLVAWKFQLRRQEDQIVKAPAGWRPIAAGKQGSEICIWAICDESAPQSEYAVQIRGTGHALGVVGGFVGTVMDGSFVWHVFAAGASS